MKEKPKEFLQDSFRLFRTLILIVIPILIIVLPIYLAISKYYQSEAPLCLSAIATAQVSNYAFHDSYSDSFDEIGWSVYGPSRYAYFLSAENYVGRDPEALGISLPLNPEAYGVPAPGLTEEGFVAVAIGDVDMDNTLDIWWINHQKVPTVSQDDVFYWKVFVKTRQAIRELVERLTDGR